MNWFEKMSAEIAADKAVETLEKFVETLEAFEAEFGFSARVPDKPKLIVPDSEWGDDKLSA